MKLIKWLAANTFMSIGLMLIMLSLPFGFIVFGSHGIDALILIPTGTILMAISYYYKFVDTTWDK